MYTTVTTLVALVASVLVSSAQGVAAQANPPPNATATRPAKTPPEQTSVPNTSPPATTTQTIGESNQKATVKKMNEDEKQKVETKGKWPISPRTHVHISNVAAFTEKAAYVLPML